MHPFPPPEGRYDAIPWEDIDERRRALFEQYELWLRRRLDQLENGNDGRLCSLPRRGRAYLLFPLPGARLCRERGIVADRL